jgi:peptidyl-tRNA hydrolase, PTH1 family
VWLIVGLGNPGQKFKFTRHNIGFRVIDQLSKELSVPLDKKRMLALWGKGSWEEQKVLLAKPQTFMNLSGQAVVKLKNFFRIATNKVIIIHDDLDLNFGQMRIRNKGGDAGNKGVKAIIESLGESEFIRVRLGISRPEIKGEGRDYVLADFDELEMKNVNIFLDQAKEAVKTIVLEGADQAMNRFNRKL